MIIKSILDTDLYKFTTSYAYMKLFPQARGTFEFIDRDNTEYPEDFIERLYLELGSLGMLHLAKDEQEYMNNNCRFIPPVYWEWLSSFKFNSGKIQASLDENGHLHIKVTDYLYKVTLYEVPILAIVSELRSRIFDNNCDLADVIKRLPAIEDAIDNGQTTWEDCEFIVGDCKGCDQMAAEYIAKYIEENMDDWDCVPCTLTIHHMFSEPRFRVGTKADDGNYYIDVRERFNKGVENESDLVTLEDCPQVHYVGGYECDTDRDSAMTTFSDVDIAFLRGKSKWKSGTAENILRRHNMSSN
jgi:hypothetical protein